MNLVKFAEIFIGTQPYCVMNARLHLFFVIVLAVAFFTHTAFAFFVEDNYRSRLLATLIAVLAAIALAMMWVRCHE